MRIRILCLLFGLICLSGMGSKVQACGYYSPSYDFEMFHVTPEDGLTAYQEQINQLLLLEWSKYIHGTVSVEESERLADLTVDDVDTLNHPVLNYARKNRDTEMLNYLRSLAQYLELTRIRMNSWDYPTKEQLSQREQKFNELNSSLKTVKVSERLRARYDLLRMRVLFRLEKYDECVMLWRNELKKRDSSVFHDMAHGFYAGALFRLGKHLDAAVEYAELGDAHNAQLCVNNQQQVSSMRQVAIENPNASVLQYMLERMMNNLDRNTDFILDETENAKFTSMFDVLAIRQKDMNELIEFANEMAERNMVTDKCLWKSAVAFTEYMQGKKEEAWQHINEAVSLPGTEASNSNARLLRLLIAVAQSSEAEMEKCFAQEKDFIRKMHNAGGIWTDNLGRIAVKGLIPHYEPTNNKNMKLMSYLFLAYAEGPEHMTNIPSYYCDFTTQFDSSTFTQMKNFYQFMYNKKYKHSDFESNLIELMAPSEESMCDLLGTRALREGKWEEALTWFDKVSLEFLSLQGIAPYAAKRDYHLEEWINYPIPVKEYVETHLTVNQKANYCREVLDLRSRLTKATGEERCEIAYQLATLYFQASVAGSCWWLTRYGKSNTLEYNDPDPEGCINLMSLAANMLRISRFSTNQNLRAKSLFASLFIPFDSMYKWTYNENYDQVIVLNKDSKRYEDLTELIKYRQTVENCEEYILKCDVLRQLIKMVN